MFTTQKSQCHVSCTLFRFHHIRYIRSLRKLDIRLLFKTRQVPQITSALAVFNLSWEACLSKDQCLLIDKGTKTQESAASSVFKKEETFEYSCVLMCKNALVYCVVLASVKNKEASLEYTHLTHPTLCLTTHVHRGGRYLGFLIK